MTSAGLGLGLAPGAAAQQHLDTVMNDDEPQTLGEVLRQVRRTDVEAARMRLGEGHCGCDLPVIPAPPTYCPEM